ncbi:hypothetical protein BH18ACT9_BH18ACT9_21420 [soil metagenome]
MRIRACEVNPRKRVADVILARGGQDALIPLLTPLRPESRRLISPFRLPPGCPQPVARRAPTSSLTRHGDRMRPCLKLMVVVALASLLLSLTPLATHADDSAAWAAGQGVWPLRPTPEVVSGFDRPDAPWAAGHRGVDLAGHVGQQVRASVAGTVTFAGMIAGRGVVVIDHGGARTTYEPVAAAVSVGTAVGAGAVLGRLTLFGSHCFPQSCLHWGLLVSDVYEDPLRLVGGGPVRLLPLDSLMPMPSGPLILPGDQSRLSGRPARPPRRPQEGVWPAQAGSAAFFREHSLI